MGITPNFTPAQFEAAVRKRMERVEQVILRRMKYVGETCVNYARENGSYTDRTGNLRSSTGYVVYKNGEMIYKGGFEQVKEGEQGTNKGFELAKSKAVEANGSGYILVVVAGMNYAFNVETKGYDVLTGAEHLAKREMKSAIKTIKRKIRKIK